jgi:uncharacterized protein (DUF433 family)
MTLGLRLFSKLVTPFSIGRESAVVRCYSGAVQVIQHISTNPDVMGGKPCVHGTQITVGMIVEALAAGRSIPDLLSDFPYLIEQDIQEALAYAPGLAKGREVPHAS